MNNLTAVTLAAVMATTIGCDIRPPQDALVCNTLEAETYAYQKNLPLALDEYTVAEKVTSSNKSCTMSYTYGLDMESLLMVAGLPDTPASEEYFSAKMAEININDFCTKPSLKAYRVAGVQVTHNYTDDLGRSISKHTLDLRDCK